MVTTDVDRAVDFLRGVAVRDPDLATRHIDPDAFVEHDPNVADGALGFWKHVDDSVGSSYAFVPVRVLQDDAFVVVQHQANTGIGLVVFEVFRFRGGQIVEHWRFSSAGGPPNKSGHTQIDGPREPRHLNDTEENKRTVRAYYDTVHIGGRHDEARRWFMDDIMIRHEPGVADGDEEFLRDLSRLIQDRTIDEVKILVGQGDLVFIVARGTHGGAPCAHVDLYRTHGGKIFEHWGFPDPFPAERTNAFVDFV